MRISELGEDRFLEKLRERVPAPGPAVRLGIGDDASVLAFPPGEDALFSTDVLVEGVHFTNRTLPPRFVGRKAVAVNVSDIAAMGGLPTALIVALSVSADSDVESLLELFDGLIARAGELGVDLVGGNLSRSPGPMVVTVSILGTTEGRRVMTRTGAGPGDAIYVSGRLGAAAEGLDLLHEGMAVSASGAVLVPAALRGGPVALAEACLRAHMDPEPRVELGRFLNRTHAATACIDLSDGLAKDLTRLCAASGVGGRIEETALPIQPGVLAWERARKRQPLEKALTGGEDYELLFTVRDEGRLGEWRGETSLPITRIGTVTDSWEGVKLILREGAERPLTSGGWDHFMGGLGGTTR